MKKNHGIAYYGMLAWMTGTSLVLPSSCTEMIADFTSNRITITVKDSGFDEEKVPTRGSMASAVSNVGVNAAVYDKDAVGGYSSAGCGSYFYNEAVTSGSPTDFLWPTSDYRMAFYAHHPYGNAAFTVQSSANALGAPTYAYTVPSAIASQVDVMTGQNVNVLGGGTAAVNLTMKHRCAAVRFSVTNNRSTEIILRSVSIEGVKFSGTLCEDSWTLSSAVNSSSTNPFSLFYGSSIAASGTADVTGTTNVFLMLPQAIPAGAKVKVVVDGEDPLYADLSGTWAAGKRYNYSLAIKDNVVIIMDEESDIKDWVLPIDLSMVDNAGADRESMTTANCYLVHAAGRYKVPLVYGNAIKNGAVNTSAFYPDVDGAVDANSPRTTLGRFVNHNGDGITGPWITKNGTGVEAGMGLTAASAELLWQDAPGLITKVSLSGDGDYLKFTVGTFAGGNALIAVKDGSGTILWSWHIWATNDDLSNTSVLSTGSHDYTVAPVNLGWVPTDEEGKKGYNSYYQWGRKDPYKPGGSTGTNRTEAITYNINNEYVVTYGMSEKSNTATIADNIKNPVLHNYNTNTLGPVNTTYYNMWDAQNTATGNVATATKKTIYDPCPPGFCVPTDNLCYFIDGGNGDRLVETWDDTDIGATWDSGVTGDALWFPATGARYAHFNCTYEINQAFYFWSATPSEDVTRGYCLVSNINIGSAGRKLWWRWLMQRRGELYSVRPVTEE